MVEMTRDRMPEGWDEASEAYDKVVFPITSLYAADAIEKLGVEEGHSLLDVAAGSGAATFAAVEAGAEVVATDFAPMMIDQLRKRLSESGSMNVETLVMDGQDLKFAAATFDRAISVFGFMFFPDQTKGMREMHRVLKDGGKAAIVTWADPSKTWPLSVWGATLREVLPDLPPSTEPPAIFSLSDPAVLGQKMTDAGFKDVTVTPIVHTFDSESAEAYWDEFNTASPVFTVMTQILGEKMDDYRAAIIAKFQERFGDGPISAESEALVCIGRKI